MAKLVLDQIVKYNETEMKQGLHVLFSAHGVPESYIESKCILYVFFEMCRGCYLCFSVFSAYTAFVCAEVPIQHNVPLIGLLVVL